MREDLSVASPSFALALALLPTILWRRSHPLLMTCIAFGSTGSFEAVGIITGRDVPDVSAQAYMLILPYALFRWGSGREALIGLPVVLGAASIGFAEDDLTLAETLGGLTVLLAPMGFGTAFRYREFARLRELEDARSLERLSLARELHDTVAHHVSAIAVRAQAGLATAASDPGAAVDALNVISSEASRTLREMRGLVRVLRDGEGAEYAPSPRIEDLQGLAERRGGGARVEIAIRGDAQQLSPPHAAAVYRLAQESVTNAQRHARGATSIRIDLTIGAASAHLVVVDDGERTAASSAGYGVMGMVERAHLLGGTLRAGPGPERGWIVEAVLPHGGAEASP